MSLEVGGANRDRFKDDFNCCFYNYQSNLNSCYHVAGR